jgi:hypothetical protein
MRRRGMAQRRDIGCNQQTLGHMAALYLRAAFTDPISGQTVTCAADQFAANIKGPPPTSSKCCTKSCTTWDCSTRGRRITMTVDTQIMIRKI